MTIRTEAQLLSLYADNTAGEIGAQDLQDFVETVYQARTKFLPVETFEAEIGANAPTPGAIGVTAYLIYVVNDISYHRIQLPEELDEDQDILLHVDWAPAAGESSKTVSWELRYTLFGPGTETIDVVDDVLTAVDVAAPSTQWEATRNSFTVPAADIAADDRLLTLSLKRALSADDPTEIVLYNIQAEVITRPPGAS